MDAILTHGSSKLVEALAVLNGPGWVQPSEEPEFLTAFAEAVFNPSWPRDHTDPLWSLARGEFSVDFFKRVLAAVLEQGLDRQPLNRFLAMSESFGHIAAQWWMLHRGFVKRRLIEAYHGRRPVRGEMPATLSANGWVAEAMVSRAEG